MSTQKSMIITVIVLSVMVVFLLVAVLAYFALTATEGEPKVREKGKEAASGGSSRVDLTAEGSGDRDAVLGGERGVLGE
jgi:flagellar basal body-associated protein FliL